MLISSAFPRNGMRRGPGGSGSLVDNFALDVQTDKKTTRQTAPVAITIVSIPGEMALLQSVTAFIWFLKSNKV